jgi:hypothetical protein
MLDAIGLDFGRLDRALPELYDAAYRRHGDCVVWDDWPPHGRIVQLSCPHAFSALLKLEGKYPSGGFEGETALCRYHEERGLQTLGFFGRGPAWRRYRGALERELLAPQSARSYLEIMQCSATASSRCASAYGDRMDEYLVMAAHDIFHAVFFGRVHEGAAQDAASRQFCADSRAVLSAGAQLGAPHQLAAMAAGESTPQLVQLDATIARMQRHVDGLVDAFVATRDAQQLDEWQRRSYLARVLQRESAPGGVCLHELRRLFTVLLMASSDASYRVRGHNPSWLSDADRPALDSRTDPAGRCLDGR